MMPNTVHISCAAWAISRTTRWSRWSARRRASGPALCPVRDSSGNSKSSTPAARAAPTTSRCFRRLASRSPGTDAVCATATFMPLDEALLLEERLRHVFHRLLVDVDTGVEPRHCRVVELRGERVQRVAHL